MPFKKRVTGPGVTERVNMVSADLGIVRWDPARNCNAVMFGDNFAERYLKGEWQSPSIVCYDADFNLLGIPAGTKEIVPSGNRRQCIPYQHANEEFTTILPCDFILLDKIWYMAAMVTKGLGNELRTVFWQSRNLVDWQKTDPYVCLDHPGHPGNVMLTVDRIKEWVYIFGTGGLHRDRGIWCWRNKAIEFPLGYWEPWGYDGRAWGWGIANEGTPVLGGRYGELCFRAIQGNCVLSFFDVDNYSCSALTQVSPTDHWPDANRVDYATGAQYPQLYGGYLAPDSLLSKPDGLKCLVSQWNTQSNDPYHVIQINDTLTAKGLLEVPLPEPEPEPEPEVPPVTDTSPQELYELLLKELAASGSTPIVTTDGRHLTLREAVGELYDQQCGVYTLTGMPTDPRHATDQLGHVRSDRAEGLFTQTVVVAIADHLGIDVDALYRQVRRSIG